MAVYLIAGRLGSGKTLSAVGRIRDALRAGKRVATNLNLDLAALGFGASRVSVVRLPDKPLGHELVALGHGNPDTLDEANNGLVVLDELASWLNARSWGDKSRQGVLDWLIHSRKLGWDVLLLAQSLNQVDKQIRDSVVEYHVICRRLDRLRVPLVGGLIRALSFGRLSGRFPRTHIAFVRYGVERDSQLVERWVYRGVDLFAAYDTRQRFLDRDVIERLESIEPDYGRPIGPYSFWLPDWVPLEVRVQRRQAAVVRLLQGVDPDKRVRVCAAYWRAQDRASVAARGAGVSGSMPRALQGQVAVPRGGATGLVPLAGGSAAGSAVGRPNGKPGSRSSNAQAAGRPRQRPAAA